MTRWRLEIDLQLLRSGMARGLTVAPLAQHPLRPGGIADEYHRDRQHQLHHDRRQHGSPWTRHKG
ncbi:hypothetical protein VB734_09465 [Synechococcus sp. BA-124 BA4]|uniref:hypothetical protein n=1 Tax=Synechococcus sp. BA-124 BA4 TaxID=3110251 RepID=UPI002B1FB4BC|nr:hypothetical protein [Synechococcus sp. BA-124 BA4]MEA5400266.1 hypothetical protein [Synechococcus sp. BA-124 BA4]